MRKSAFFRFVLLSMPPLLLAAVPAAAVEILGGETVVIAAGEVKGDDVIVAAGTFRLEGTIRGDLIVAGGAITVAPGGVVEGDLIAGGRSIVIEGQVLDDARIAGAVLSVGERAVIGDDLIGAGQSLETRAGSSIRGELVFGGGQALLAGIVAQGARIGAGALELRGRIGGHLVATVGKSGQAPPFSPLAFLPDLPPMPVVPPGLTVREGARVDGNLRYTSEEEVAIPAGVVGGEVVHRTPEQAPEQPAPGKRALDTVRSLGALLVVGLLLLWLAPALVQGGAAVLRSRPGASLGWGLIALFASLFVPLAIVLATVLIAVVLGLLSLGGLTALAILGGIAALFVYVLALVLVAVYVSKVVAAFLAGRLLLARVKPEWAQGRVAPLLVGVLLLVLLGAVPFLGRLIHLLAVLAGLGALCLLAGERLRSRRIRRTALGPGEPVAPAAPASPPAAMPPAV